MGTMYNDTIIGSTGNDYIEAFEGADLIQSGAGNDTIFGDGPPNQINALGGIFGQTSGNIAVPVNAFDLTLYTTAFIDTMVGGTGNDTYYANHGAILDVIIENAGEGIDTVQSLADIPWVLTLKI